MPRNKFGAVKTWVDGIEFASKAEARRYGELKLLERAKQITALQVQPKFLLIPQTRRPDGVLERPAHYLGDFEYVDAGGQRVIEDVKSPATRTPVYILKRKLMLQLFGIAVREIG